MKSVTTGNTNKKSEKDQIRNIVAFAQKSVINFVYKSDYNPHFFVVSFVEKKSSTEGSETMPRMIVIPPKEEPSVTKIRVAAYCRVSTNHTEQENSYETQVRYFSSLYNDSETEQLVGIYADEGISGTSIESRVSFIKMMDDCRRGKIDRIVTKSLSRFARNTKDCLSCIRELSELGISVKFEKENIDTARMSDEMMITVMGGLAQEESGSISKNVRWSIQKRMAKGTYGHARVPYGYKKNKKNKGLAIDRKQADVVRRIFDMYINGIGMGSIAKALNNEGIPSPTGIEWNDITISKMLRQEKYIGDTLWQKTYSEFMGPMFQINRGQQPKYYIKGSHPAIIDKETFDLAASIRKKRRGSPGRQTDSLFRGKLICGCCGHVYSLIGGRTRLYWQCNHRYGISEQCENPIIYDKTLRIALEALCDKLHSHGKPIFDRCIKQFELLERMSQTGTATTAQLYEQIADLKEQRHRLAVLRTKGYISDEKYTSQENEIGSAIIKLTSEIDKLNSEKDTAADDTRMLTDIFEKYDGSEEYRMKILSEVIERMTVTNYDLTFELPGGLKFTERTKEYEET